MTPSEEALDDVIMHAVVLLIIIVQTIQNFSNRLARALRK
jgi:ABC-type methionine transport system permease subunit